MNSENKAITWKRLDRAGLAKRAAKDIPDGWYANRGVGVPKPLQGESVRQIGVADQVLQTLS